MLVSVVVPAYNQAAYLREALASALAQSHRELEVIVVDDGSTDDTQAVCEGFGDARLRYVRQANDGTRGIGARNAAMLLARGQWIALLDQDDRWAPQKIEKQLECVRDRPEIGLVFCRARFIDGQGNVTGEQPDDLPEGEVFHALLERNRYYAVTGMVRRSLLSVAGLPHESAGLADWVLWMSAAKHAPVAVVCEALADYRIHAEGYQAGLLNSDRLRFAYDQWLAVMSQRTRLHPRCSACRRAHRRARRDLVRLQLTTLRELWRAGRYDGTFETLRAACAGAPMWLLRPSVLVRYVWQLAGAAIIGLSTRRQHSG